MPLIGFSGSPFTLACYMVEGGSSSDFRRVKTMLYDRPDLLHRILSVTSDAVIAYLNAQIETGAQDAFASLSDVDRAQFSGVMSQLGRLGGVIASVTAQASALVGELAKAAQIDPGTKRLEALRQQHAAQSASMSSLDAMRAANETDHRASRKDNV